MLPQTSISESPSTHTNIEVDPSTTSLSEKTTVTVTIENTTVPLDISPDLQASTTLSTPHDSTLDSTETTSVSETTTASSPVQNTLSLVDMSSPVARNEIVTLKVKGVPNTKYDILVYYSTSVSKADGLESKMSDAQGNVSWTWKIGGKTGLGDHYLYVKGGGSSLKVNFTVQ